MQFEDVRDFFRTYYHPSNASLALAGDIDTAHALELADAYFGGIPAGVRPAPVTAPAAPPVAARLALEDRVELPRLYMAWHSPRMFAPGDAEMDLVGDLLANGKTSRLYRMLVYERRLALDVSAFQSSRELGSFFLLVVTAAPGRALGELAQLIDEALLRVADEGPTDEEMERALAQAEAHFMYRLQTVGGFGGKSDQLNAYNVMQGDPGYFTRDLDRYRAASRQSLQAAARDGLRLGERVILSVVPRGQPALAVEGSTTVAVS